MRRIVLSVCVLLSACGLPDTDQQDEISLRQQPTTTAPGVTISGSADFGIKRGF